jgi:GNAT superfamily N-acetyltransferase
MVSATWSAVARTGPSPALAIAFAAARVANWRPIAVLLLATLQAGAPARVWCGQAASFSLELVGFCLRVFARAILDNVGDRSTGFGVNALKLIVSCIFWRGRVFFCCIGFDGECFALMTSQGMDIKDGYFDIPAGKIAFVVTALEMLDRPLLRGAPVGVDASLTIQLVSQPDVEWFRDLYRHIGENWLWFSRLKLSFNELETIIRHPQVEIYTLRDASGRDEGLLELDFREKNECELAFFGVRPALFGSRAGRQLMNYAIDRAWTAEIRRFWVHTCTGDHPAALAFYIRSGFTPFKRQIEIADDPRLDGLLPVTAAPHVPLIRPR